jgi:NAD+ synthase (glutamine-hydrolysing)
VARIRIGLAQLNTSVGDVEANAAKVSNWAKRAEAEGCDIAAFPELAVTGYPPEDLLLKPGFVGANQAAVEKVVAQSGACVNVVGFVDATSALHNAAAIAVNGRLVDVYRKRQLPNYSVFDEERYFEPGDGDYRLIEVAGVRVGVAICEDAWIPGGPVQQLADGGAQLVIVINASPYQEGKQEFRQSMLSTRAADAGCWLAYVNQVGGQDELVFDGGSMFFGPDGALVASAREFVEDLLVCDIEVSHLVPKNPKLVWDVALVSATSRATGPQRQPVVTRLLDQDEAVLEALVVGTRDYVDKTGFSEVGVAMSGGIDSSLVAAIAVEALGSDRVHGVGLPSRYSSEGSLTDARALADNLGIDFRVIDIEPMHAAFESALTPTEDLTEQNLQSRIRGVTMMGLSNDHGWLILTTGNKSELAVGYSTLYGDTAGGFAVIKDAFKTQVYHLCHLMNRRAGREVIPESVLTKAPSAELRPDQTDAQSLPPYDMLDAILEGLIENDLSIEDVISEGFDPDIVSRVAQMVDRAEYKRRQSPLGVRVTAKAFGKDRRMPIANKYIG